MLDRLRSWSFFDMAPRPLAVAGLALLGALVVGVYAVGALDLLHERYRVTAVFEDSGGLKPGAPVRMAGVEVGEVAAVTPDFSLGQVVVDLDVDTEVDLGHETRARIAPNTVLGGFHVRLSGVVEPPLLADLGDTDRRIPLERTRLTHTVVDALEATSGTVDDFDLEAINALMARIADTVEANGDDFNQLVDRLDAFAGLVHEREDELSRLLDHGSDLTATLRSRDREVLALSATARDVVDRLVERREGIDALLQDGTSGVDRLTALIETNRTTIETGLDDLGDVLEVTDRNLTPLNRGLSLLPESLHGIGRAGASGGWVDVVLDHLLLLEVE